MVYNEELNHIKDNRESFRKIFNISKDSQCNNVKIYIFNENLFKEFIYKKENINNFYRQIVNKNSFNNDLFNLDGFFLNLNLFIWVFYLIVLIIYFRFFF